jgi:hypothetical protein
MTGLEAGEEEKREHLQKLGPELGVVYHELYNEVVWLHAKWLEYRKLFAKSEKQIELLNATAPFFFYTIESALREDILLHIARLTDHPRSGKSKRLSLLLLPTLTKDRQLADELQTALDACLLKCAFARDVRNKQIAHTNYTLALNPEERVKSLPGVSRQQIGDALDSIAQILNKLTDTPTSFGIFHTLSGGNTLVFYLEEGLKSEKRKRERFRKGNPLPEDFN